MTSNTTPAPRTPERAAAPDPRVPSQPEEQP